MAEWRRMARIKQQLTNEECVRILRETRRGVLSVIGDDGYPYGVPINHFWRDADGCLYFHGGRFGHKIDALRNCDKVSFCAYDEGVRAEGEWWLTVRSVVVFGRAEFVDDEDLLVEVARDLSLKFTSDEAYISHEIEHDGPRTLLIRLVPEHITGKRVTEK